MFLSTISWPPSQLVLGQLVLEWQNWRSRSAKKSSQVQNFSRNEKDVQWNSEPGTPTFSRDYFRGPFWCANRFCCKPNIQLQHSRGVAWLARSTVVIMCIYYIDITNHEYIYIYRRSGIIGFRPYPWTEKYAIHIKQNQLSSSYNYDLGPINCPRMFLPFRLEYVFPMTFILLPRDFPPHTLFPSFWCHM